MRLASPKSAILSAVIFNAIIIILLIPLALKGVKFRPLGAAANPYGIFAARIAWAFRYYGAEARVLDGGWSTWREEGRPVSEGAVERHRTRFTARPRPRLRRTLAEVRKRGPAARHSWTPARATCSWASTGLRTRATSRDRAVSLPGAGRRRDRALGRA